MGGLRRGLDDGFAFAAHAPTPDRFGREDDQRYPDEAERDQVRAGKRLVVEEDAEKETAAGSEVLKKAKRGQAKVPGRMAEPDQRQAGHHPRAEQEKNQ